MAMRREWASIIVLIVVTDGFLQPVLSFVVLFRKINALE